MTEAEVIRVLEEKNLTFTIEENSDPEKILTIPAENKKTKIDVILTPGEDGYILYDLVFGMFCFELFQNREDVLREQFKETLQDILDGNIAIVQKTNPKTGRWIADNVFYLDEGNFLCSKEALDAFLTKLEKPAGIFHRKRQYEIFDWTHYRSVIK